MARKLAGGAGAGDTPGGARTPDDEEEEELEEDAEAAPALGRAASSFSPALPLQSSSAPEQTTPPSMAGWCASGVRPLLLLLRGGGSAEALPRRRWLARAALSAVLALTALLAFAWVAGEPDGAGPRWRVAVCHSWADTRRVVEEMHVLSTVVQRGSGGAAGPLVATPYACDGWLGVPRGVDVVLFGPYGPRDAVIAAARRLEGRAVRVYLGSEPWPTYDDGLAEHMDVSLGHRRDVDHPAYLRMPWWLPYSVAPPPPSAPPLTGAGGSGGGDTAAAPPPTCAFLPALQAAPDPEAWAARAGDAALLSSHANFPRPELYKLLTRSGRAVAAPGKAFRNMEWPPELPNSHLTGKVDFLARYRYNVCPENVQTGRGGGYATEKLPHAHMAGAVPLYWGDPLDAAVWNPARVLLFNGTNGADLLAAMDALERDAAARAAWFARPALAPDAGAWLEAWCDDAGARLLAAHGRLLEARRRRKEADAGQGRLSGS